MTLPIAVSAHTESMTSLCFGPDHDLVITGGADKCVRLWDVATNTLLREYIGHTDAVTSLAVVTEFGELLSASLDCTVHHWILSTGTRTNAYRGHSKAIADLAIGPTNKYFATAGRDGSVQLWRVGHRTPQRIIGHCDGPLSSLDYSDSNELLAVGAASDRIDIYEHESWSQVRQISIDTDAVQHVRFLPGDDLLIVGEDGKLVVQDVIERSNRFTLQLDSAGEQPIALSPDKKRLYLGVGGEIQPVELLSGTRLDRIRLPASKVTAVAVSPDGERLAFGSRSGKLRVRPLQETPKASSSR